MNKIDGGVCAAKGFRAAGVHCGIRKNTSKNDLAVVCADRPCTAAAVYTQNLVKGAPLIVTAENIADGRAQAIICNSGNANTCNADGIEKARRMCDIASCVTGVSPKDVIVASTGVIGQPLPIEPVESAVGALRAALSADGATEAAKAIMTTDTVIKQSACEFTAGGKLCRIGAMCKGSGMIHPNMATMLCFVTTDAAVSSAMLDKALHEVVVDTFNMLSVDGDTSTNDMVCVLASGAAENAEITSDGADYDAFKSALLSICTEMVKLQAGDGEGATKMLECRVCGAVDTENARIIAKSVICSSLVKAAMFGSDANWGRVLCAIGYCGAKVDINAVDVAFVSAAGRVEVCKNGAGIDFSEELAKTVLTERDIIIEVVLHDGGGEATAWGCDLTYDYVKINGDYRT
jgi:glutamate N-acetyltransferase/amino-acid N-acetyltransferase